MSEELSDFPRAFARLDPPLPWEVPDSGIVWQWGRNAGKLLHAFRSEELIHMRKLVERKQGRGSYFQMYLDEIERVLTERQGL